LSNAAAPLLRRSARACAYGLAAVVIVAAVTVTALRAFVPLGSHLRADVEAMAGDYLGRPVRIASFTTEWRGLQPVLRLRGVELLEGAGTVAAVRELEVRVDVLASLRTWGLRPASVQAAGLRLAIRRDADGVLSVDGLGGTGSAGGAWAWPRGVVAVSSSELHWYDAHAPGPLHLTDVSLHLQGDGVGRWLSGSARLADGGEAALSLELPPAGDPAREGRLRVSAAGIDVAALSGAWEGALQVAGHADLELEAHWSDAVLQTAVAGFEVRGLSLSASATPADAARLARVAGQVHWRRHTDGWHLHVGDVEVVGGGGGWSAGHLALSLDAPEEGAALLRAEAGRLRLDDLVPFVQELAYLEPAADSVLGRLPAGLGEVLSGLRPRGELRDLRLAYRPDDGGYAVRLGLTKLGVEAWRSIPEVSGLSGFVRADGRGGSIALASETVAVAFPGLFREPIEVERATGRLTWAHTPDGWRLSSERLVASNRDIRTESRLSIELPAAADAVPVLDLDVRFAEGDVERVPRYLPVGILPADVVAWLDRSLVSGTVTDGRFLFRGAPKHFPFDDDKGRFEVRFEVRDAVLDYRPDYPPVEGLDAEVVFAGRAMHIQAHGGRMRAGTLGPTRAAIENLGKPHLSIQGELHAPAADLLWFLREGPLAPQYGGFVEGVHASGRHRLELGLDLPLDGQPAHVQGRLRVQDLGLSLPETGLELTEVNGTLSFGEAGISADDLQGRFLGAPLRIAVESKDGETLVAADGQVDLEWLAGQAELPLLARLNGAADWLAALRIPSGVAGWRGTSVDLELHSDLRGVGVDLPAPLGKSPDEVRALHVRASLPVQRGEAVRVRYGGILSAALDLHIAEAGFELAAGELRFGAGVAELPPTPGLRLTGAVEALALDEWQDLLGSAGGTALDDPAGLQAVDLRVQRLQTFGREFQDIWMAAQRTAREWVVRLEGRQIAGLVRVPHASEASRPVTVQLEHLHLEPLSASPGGRTPDPRRIPAVRVTSGHFQYGELDFGRLELTARPRDDGLRLERLTLSSPELDVDARGDWQLMDGEQRSRFEVQIDSVDAGAALARLGYASGIEGGSAKAHLDASWPGAPTQFALEILDGRLHVQLMKGELLDIEPGMGRVFGLLSVQALPRRLALDFRDFVAKGFRFDRIEGDFSIVDGHAYTHNLFVEAPAAHIEITGRTGLAERDYDQLVTVTPRVGGTLPLAGALAGGPGVGVAVYLAERIFRGQIEDIARHQYTVTGGWDQPRVERVRRPDNGQP
jgi:uncharacterized protein (TIGR02099 family)